MAGEAVGFVIIKGNYYCPWCEAAADFLKERGHDYAFRVLCGGALMEAGKHARMSTVPIIYHGVRLVGGFQHLRKYLDIIAVGCYTDSDKEKPETT
jgi:glutaredoxin